MIMQWRQWVASSRLRVSTFWDEVLGVSPQVSLSEEAERDLRERLGRTITWILLGLGVPVNLLIALHFYQKVFVTQEFAVVVMYNHAFWYAVCSIGALLMLRRGRGIGALYVIIVGASISAFIQMYLVNNIGEFLGMLLIMATPAFAFRVSENLKICVVLVLGAVVMQVVFGVAGPLRSAVLAFLSLQLSFITFSAGVRRVLAQTLAQREHDIKRLVEAEAQTQLAIQRAEEGERRAIEQERNRFTRELHDQMGSAFTSIGVHAEVVLQALSENKPVRLEQARTALGHIQHIADSGVDRLRSAISNLRDDEQPRPLAELIDDELAELEASGIQTHLTCPPVAPPFAPYTTTELLRVVQEALTNVKRHAQATRVDVELDDQDGHCVTLTIEDNGQGCDAEHMTRGFGLQGINERVAAIDGTMQIWTQPGQGFQIVVEVPL